VFLLVFVVGYLLFTVTVRYDTNVHVREPDL